MAKKRRTLSRWLAPWFINVVAPAILVFTILATSLVFLSISASELNQSRQEEMVVRRADRARANIEASLTAYEDTLRMAGGIVSLGDGQITQQSWSELVQSLKLEDRHHGILGIGFARIVPIEDRLSHEEEIQTRNGFQNYSISPENTSNDTYASIVHVSPLDEQSNSSLIGLDLYSDEYTAEALEYARDTGAPSIILLPNSGIAEYFEEPKQDMMLALPVYHTLNEQETTQERKDSIVGYTFLGINSTSFFSNILIDEGVYIYKISLGSSDKEDIIYTSREYQPYPDKASVAIEPIEFSGETLSLTTTNIQEVLPRQELDRPRNILIAGTVFVLSVTGFIYMLGLTRAQRVKEREVVSVNEAKDELLALASHQLRTPATGVKQYLGMLQEGYAGELSENQIDLIRRAYEGNERQLRIVNELLFLARIDSGRIRLQYMNMNFSQFITDIVEDIRAHEDQEDKTIQLDLPKEEIHIEADDSYLRMAIENIIDNACKYTKEDGKVLVRLRRKSNELIQLTVKDNGMGVAKKDIPTLFEKFTRMPSSHTGVVSGSGIGLYLSKKIIETHGGTITFESEINKGSTVRIALPDRQNTQSEGTLNISQ